MKTIRWSLFVCASLVFAAACAENTASTPPRGAAQLVAAKSDPARARAHLKEHVTYPASRSQVLEACAGTKEFNDVEKQWFSDNLPDGQYASAQEVMSALKLDADCGVPAAVTCND